MNVFIIRMKEAIQTLGITQKVFAEQAGITPGYLSDILKGRTEPSGRVVSSICDGNKLNLVWLVDGVGEMRQGGGHQVNEALDHYGPALNRDVLDKAIERTEFILEKTNRSLSTAQKATFISTLYEMAMEQGESALDESNVTRLIRLVG